MFCFWLAWYISKPVKRLREVSNNISQGNLSARLAPSFGYRRDELGDLGKDFDHMAGQLQSLMLAQTQLLSDVSHELRSPLARLSIALGLANKSASDDTIKRQLARIENEIVCLDTLIGEILALSRVESVQCGMLEDYVDVAELINSIIEKVDIEAVERKVTIKFVVESRNVIFSNANLLGRAIENIIRNAIYYSDCGSSVSIALQEAATDAAPR